MSGRSTWRNTPNNQTRSYQTPAGGYTSVDAYGNVTRTTVQSPVGQPTYNTTPSMAAALANQAMIRAYGAPNTSLKFNQPNNGYNGNGWRDHRDDDRDDDEYCPPSRPAYYPPAYPAPYPYPYAYPTNNYYYPASPYTIPIGPQKYDWQTPPTITVAPTGNYAGGYGAPAYPYPYPAYPTPYPYANPYPGYPYYYPGSTTTIITGSGQGSISTQSSTSGYGLSVGKGGVSANINNRQSSSTTTVTAR